MNTPHLELDKCTNLGFNYPKIQSPINGDKNKDDCTGANFRQKRAILQISGFKLFEMVFYTIFLQISHTGTEVTRELITIYFIQSFVDLLMSFIDFMLLYSIVLASIWPPSGKL